MDTTETHLLKFEIEAGDAISEQEILKKLLIDLKQEASDLQKAYKAGNITLNEFASESVRVENTQKKLVSQYSNVQRSVTGLKNPIKELTESNKHLSEQFSKLGEKIEFGGVSLSGLTSKIASFANPATAAIGLVTALGAAYVNSAVGAKDLEFAEHELAAGIQLASNAFGEFLSSSKEGEGLFTKIFEGIITGLTQSTGAGSAIVATIHAAAQAQEQLQKNERELNKLKAEGNERLLENQDALTKINDSQTKYNEKVFLFAKIAENLKANRDEQVKNLNDQIELLRSQEASTKNKEALDGLINDKIRERTTLEKTVNRLMQSNERLASNTADAEQKATEAIRLKIQYQAPGIGKKGEIDTTDSSALFGTTQDKAAAESERLLQVQQQFFTDAQKQTEEYVVPALQTWEEFYEHQREADANLNRLKIEGQKAVASEAQNAFIVGSGLAKKGSIAQKILASSATLISTYQGATLALATYPPPGGEILAGIRIALGLANLAKINAVEFASGGYTGQGGKYEPKGVVHGNEFVVPSETVSAYGGPAYFNKYLPRYDVGGYVSTSAATAKFDQQITMSEMLKNIPAPVLSYREFTEFQKRVSYKEQATAV